jgi:hypothetical protein
VLITVGGVQLSFYAVQMDFYAVQMDFYAVQMDFCAVQMDFCAGAEEPLRCAGGLSRGADWLLRRADRMAIR